MTVEEKRLQEILQEIAGRTEESYPCTPTPGIQFAPDGRISEVISKAGQIRIKKRGQSQWENWAPTLYQSCMNPEQFCIYCLMIKDMGNGKLGLKTLYKEETVDLRACETEVSPWIPQIHKSDCLHCTNCGKCSW